MAKTAAKPKLETPSVADLMADMDAHLTACGVDPRRYPWGVDQTASERTRYAQGGQGAGSGVVRHASDKQKALIRRLMAERDTSKLVRLPGAENIDKIGLKGATDLIDRLFGCPMRAGASLDGPPASDRQKAFVTSLLADKDLAGTAYPAWTSDAVAALTMTEARAAIDMLLTLPRAVVVTHVAPITDGMYLCDGQVIKVQRALSGDRLYAKVFIEGDFVYRPGAMRGLTAEHRMTIEQAAEYGRLYGVCMKCGRRLTDEESIEAGIGRICRDKW